LVDTSVDVATSAASTRPALPATEALGHRLLRWSLLVVPLLVLLERGWARRYMSDDGFIYLRVAKQLVDGHGPVFNAGERVEAATGPLWVGALAVSDVVTPIRLEWLAVGLGIGLTVIGLALAMTGARTLADIRGSSLAIPAGAAVLVAVPPLWTFSSSGLETGLVFAWLGACLWLLARWAAGSARVSAPVAIVLGIGVLIRPDLGLFTVAFLAVAIVGSTGWRDRLRVVAWAVALPVLYQVFRMGYYGVLAPNPAAAKEASDSRWDAGWDYLRSSVDPYWLWFPVLVLALGVYLPLIATLWRDRRTRRLLVVGAFVVAALVHVGYVIRVGGDFMHARMLLIGLFAFAAPVAVIPARREYAAALLLVPWVLAGLFSLRSDRDQNVAFGTGAKNPVVVEDFGWGKDGPQQAFFTGEGAYFANRRLAAEPVPDRKAEVASYGVGIVGYALGTDVYVLDLLGLGDAFTAHLELEKRGATAHEKPLPAPWIAARLTSPSAHLDAGDFRFPQLPSSKVREIDDPAGQSLDERVEIARATLECGDLRDFLRSHTGSLTVGGFFGNIVDAAHNSSFRIPPEPRDARARFC
jgi:arabinofuranosyltransferase